MSNKLFMVHFHLVFDFLSKQRTLLTSFLWTSFVLSIYIFYSSYNNDAEVCVILIIDRNQIKFVLDKLSKRKK